MHFDFSLLQALDKTIFAAKRREQIETADRIWSMKDYEKQYKIVKIFMDALFPVSLRITNCMTTLKHLS